MIPKKIHYCWFGGNPKPKSVEKCIKSWKKHCPDYEIIEWNEDNYDVNKNKYMKESYKEKKWGFVPDYARLDIIYNYGGIYLDTDVQIIRSFDDLLENDSFFGFEDDIYSYCIALGLGFAACKGNAFIKELLDSYNDLSFYNDDGSMNLTPAPILNSPVFLRNGFIMNNKLQCINGNTAYPSEYFDPKNFQTGLLSITPNTHSIHQYDASWFDDEAQNEKKTRWKEERKKFIIDRIRHFPNRALIKLLGMEKYEKLKFKLKK